MGRGRAYVDDDIDESKFKTSEAMNRYKKIFSVQRVTVEREVKFSDFEDLGLRRIFKSRGWLLAMGPSEPANIQIVREFYANIPPFSAEQKSPPGLGPFGSCLWDETLHFSSGREYPDSFDVYLRGKVLNFSVSGIAQLLKLARRNPNEKSPGFPGLVVDNLDLKLVKFTLGWNKRVRVLRENRLSDFYKVLNTIVRYNIDPPCHVIPSLLSPDRARLLYAIGNNVPIDLATYIFRVICRAAFPTSMPDSLPFTPTFKSLITRFAMAYHVPVEPTDKVYNPWSPLDNMDIFGYSFTPSSPAVKQPQAVVSHTPNMALLTNGVAEHRGDVHPVSTHLVIPPSSKQPSAVSAGIDPEERLLDSSLIDFDRASLLYAIGNNNVSIDLPAHIFRAICLAATPDDYYETHSLPFGSLITRFAMASKVRIDPTDQLKQLMPPIN
ncbi:unnamed protein product [Prunus brigantina]